MTMRTFIAVEIEPDVRQTLGRLLETLKGRFPDVRWSKPHTIHVTLRFLGDVDDRLIPEVARAAREAARQVPPFELALGAPAGFGGRSPRVLLLDVAGQIDVLGRLQTALEEELDRRGFGREGRAFKPHLTLGRAGRSHVPESWRDLASPPPAAWGVEELVVFSSTLTPQGPLYTALARCPLGSEDAAPEEPKQLP
jgi:RNA 2',3'-cyclic 3'-phosphodiesterase